MLADTAVAINPNDPTKMVGGEGIEVEWKKNDVGLGLHFGSKKTEYLDKSSKIIDNWKVLFWTEALWWGGGGGVFLESLVGRGPPGYFRFTP